MRAIQVFECGPPEVMSIQEIEPPACGPDQVRLRVHAIGVNPVDTYIRAGSYTLSASLPYTPGWECAAEVIAIGQEVTGFHVGQRVYTTRTSSGAYAEQAIAHAGDVHPLPPSISYEQGAAIGIAYATAYRALFGAGARSLGAGLRVLVHGASGAVGLASVQLAIAAGAYVVGTASSDAGRALILASGANEAWDHSEPGHLARGLGGAEGFDLIVEMAAHLNLNDDLEALRRGGKVAVVGSRGELMFNPRGLMGKELKVEGVMLYGASDQAQRVMHEAIYAGLVAQELKPQVGQVFALEDAPKAHHALFEGSAQGKIILTP